MPRVRLVQVTKMYKNKDRRAPAVLEANLSVEQGEFVFLAGPKGSGKTTFLELMAGRLYPDNGAVYIDDINLRHMNLLQRRKVRHLIGRVPEECALVRTETVLKNLSSRNLWDRFRDRVINEPLIQKSLGLVGMPDCEKRYPLEFTQAECRRIELAKAILYSPAILLLDGMNDDLDEDTLWDLLHLLSEMNKRGTTVVMASNAARYVSLRRKRVITLAEGKVVSDVKKGR